MMRGRVLNSKVATIDIKVTDARSVEVELLGTIDTGFDGDLGLPPETISELGLLPANREFIKLADDSLVEHDVYTTLVRWHGGQWFKKVYAFGSEPLIGTGLLQGSKLEVEYVPDGDVRISRIRN